MTGNSANLPVGAHVSTAGGVYHAIENGMAIGATAIQIFSKNQTRWQAKPISEEDAERFRSDWGQSNIRDVVIHDSYLINLGSPDRAIVDKSRQAFLDEVDRADQLGIGYLVFHPGSYLDSTEEKGMKMIADSLKWTRDSRPEFRVRLLLEATAGQGTNLGFKFEQLAHMINLSGVNENLGVCLDTAHMFAAGYDISTRAGYEETFKEFDSVIGFDNLYAIHVNDSKKELGSRVDRHEKLGEGLMGLDPFRFLMMDTRLAAVPKILEIPGGPEVFRDNIELLRSMATGRKPIHRAGKT